MFQPRYQITPGMLNKLSEMAVIQEKIATCPIHPKAELNLKRAAVLSMIHHSTAIEGNTLNLFEVRQVMEGKKVAAPEREIYEVKNYKKALDFISKKNNAPITSATILKIHKLATAQILPPTKNGHFRREPVYVVRRTLTSQQILYTAPDYKNTPGLVKDLCQWLKDAHQKKLSPVIMAGLAHAEIAAIHPFADGNGRTARLLATLILYQEKYDFRKLFALENYYNSNRPAYYKAIHLGKNYEERARADMTSWLDYFITGFLSEMELVLDKIKPFFYLTGQAGKRFILDQKELKILDFLQTINSITSRDIEGVLSITKRTAQRYLKKLLEKGLIKKQGGKKNAVYYLK